jgi:hypothetical protein
MDEMVETGIDGDSSAEVILTALRQTVPDAHVAGSGVLDPEGGGEGGIADSEECSQ